MRYMHIQTLSILESQCSLYFEWVRRLCCVINWLFNSLSCLKVRTNFVFDSRFIDAEKLRRVSQDTQPKQESLLKGVPSYNRRPSLVWKEKADTVYVLYNRVLLTFYFKTQRTTDLDKRFLEKLVSLQYVTNRGRIWPVTSWPQTKSSPQPWRCLTCLVSLVYTGCWTKTFTLK